MFINVSKTKLTAELIQLLKAYTSKEFQANKTVLGFVFESHFLSLSNTTKESLEELSFPEEAKYVFLCCVSKGYQGNANCEVEDYLKKKNIKVQYVEHLIVGEDIAASESFAGAKKSKELEEAVEKMADALEKREKNNTQKALQQ